MVVVEHLAQRGLIVRVGRERRREPRHRAFLHRRARRRARERRAVLEQFEGVAERHAVEALHELDHVARRLARHAPPQPFCRRHVQRRIFVVVERAQADQVAALRFQFDAARADHRREICFAFYPVDFVVRDHRHGQACVGGFPPIENFFVVFICSRVV